MPSEPRLKLRITGWDSGEENQDWMENCHFPRAWIYAGITNPAGRNEDMIDALLCATGRRPWR